MTRAIAVVRDFSLSQHHAAASGQKLPVIAFYAVCRYAIWQDAFPTTHEQQSIVTMMLPAQAILRFVEKERAPIGQQSGGATRWSMVTDDQTGMGKLIRNAISLALYRGQNKHHDPSWPSICRDFDRHAFRVADLDPTHRVSLFKALVLNRWFAAELTKHPMIKWAQSQNIVVDPIAIAQHYGIPTAYVDLSESFAIAAFFATCRFEESTGSWEPMTCGNGVIYCVQFTAMDARISPICYQPFPRPSLQWAWTAELRLGESFLHAPTLRALHFEHDRRVGEEMLRRFDGGLKLFPPDPSARLASEMCAASEVPIICVEEVESWLANDPNGLSALDAKAARQSLQNELKIAISGGSSVTYTQGELHAAELDWRRTCDDFFVDSSFRCTRPMDDPA